MTNPFWDRVRDAFDAAFDLPDADRAAAAAAVAAGDAGVLREALALLGCDARGFLEGSAAFPVDADLLQSQLPTDAVVQGYRIVRLVGRGGMGEVYEASRDGADFRKRVAIKVVRAGTISPDALRRFEQERRILAGLEHRNIATMLDGGLLPDGRPFLVMELVEGVRITEWCATARLGIDARLALFRQICAAVGHAHRNLVVHRDLKPGNILVTADGSVKLLDFGIAKVLDAEAPGGADSTATRAGAAGLTPGYAAPEQLAGGAVTTATDLYALGLLLFELLTGARPFATGTQPLPELTRLVLTTEPPMPSERVAPVPLGLAEGAVRRALRGDLDAIVLRCLRTDPQDRYRSVDALVDDLQRHQQGLPVEAMRGHRGYRLGKFVGRHRAALLATAIILVALVAGTVATLRQSRLTTIQRARAEETNHFLTEMLSSVDPAAAGKEVPMVAVLDSAAARISRDSLRDPEVEASLQTAIGVSYRALGKFDAAVPHLERVVALRARQEADPLALAQAYRDLALDHDGAGRYALADSLYRLAQAVLPVRGDSGVTALETELLFERARMQSLRGDLPGAEKILTDIVRRQEARFGPRSIEAATALSQLGVTLQQQFHLEPAESLTREALTIFRERLPTPHPDIGRTEGRLATILDVAGKRAAADSAYHEALAMLDATLGPGHPDVAWIRANYAGFLVDGKEWQRAIAEADGVLRFRGRSIPETHPMLSLTLQQRAQALAGEGKHADAIAGFREALALRRQVMPPGHWTIGSTESLLGEELVRASQRDEGIRDLRDGCRLLHRTLGPDHRLSQEALRRLVAAGEPGSSCR